MKCSTVTVSRGQGWWIDSAYHDQNTPCDSPLLGSNDTSTLGRRSQLGDVDGNLGRADTDRDTVNEATSNQHADVLCSTRDDGANDPNGAADLDCATTTELVGEITRDEGTDEGTTGHGSCDATLYVGRGAGAGLLRAEGGAIGSLVEVAAVLLCGKAAAVSCVAVEQCQVRSYMALMELMSKPNRPPPMTAMAVMP
jgi:hypothetical protein